MGHETRYEEAKLELLDGPEQISREQISNHCSSSMFAWLVMGH